MSKKNWGGISGPFSMGIDIQQQISVEITDATTNAPKNTPYTKGDTIPLLYKFKGTDKVNPQMSRQPVECGRAEEVSSG